MVFPVIIYRCEIWTIKKAEHQRIDAFELWCWRRLLRVPLTARRSNQSFLKEISPEYSLEWLVLKLKLQYFGHLMWRTDSVEKTLMLGKIEDGRRRGWQRMIGWHHWLDGHEFEQALGVGDKQGSLAYCSPWGPKSQTWLSDWIETNIALMPLRHYEVLGRTLEKKKEVHISGWRFLRYPWRESFKRQIHVRQFTWDSQWYKKTKTNTPCIQCWTLFLLLLEPRTFSSTEDL